MMRSSRSRWMGGIRALFLIGGLLLASGPGVTPAQAKQENSTLRWDQVLPVAERFVVLAAFNNEAVLDRETGLVREQSPVTTEQAWGDATRECVALTTGGRRGWRLPSVHELASLVDPSVSPPGPALPSGHPFTGVQSTSYWSATTSAEDPVLTWSVSFAFGDVGTLFKDDAGRVWCVRGGMNADRY